MTVTKLVQRRVEKPWGRRDLFAKFGRVGEDSEPVGEIWFEHPDGRDVELLVKYLFTSERLSIQVHPDDAGARRAGHKRGKEEAWVVLEAEPGATIGLGLTAPTPKPSLRQAALDGSIERMLDWRPAEAGDVYYSPAGTVHALGAGLKLIEVQQNVDLTYRLYDYGRPRELHLEEGVEAAEPAPYRAPSLPFVTESGREVLAHGRAFVLERWGQAITGTLQASLERPVWLVPVSGAGRIDGAPLEAGGVWLVDGPAELSLDAGAEILAAYPGGEVTEGLI